MKLTKRSLFLLSLITLLGMGGVGLAIIIFVEGITLQTFLHSGAELPQQLFYGFTYGLGISLLAVIAVQDDLFEETNALFSDMIAEIKPSILEIMFYSMCAAVGEELLFRGAIQPYVGIWVTSLLFIALHGYLSFTKPMMALYGLFMVCVSAGMGYLLVFHGIYASIAAHFVYDVVMFLHLRMEVAKKDEE